ncbi:hypothetical protein LNKW23_41910 [Paralimibaculum aggregatum]|uniref:Uncharacterized protein n=1 Tax=Paralimibaculum aggregatum TaxID=3036245 RepID=A0ABQ6LP12_9RHOB|nr:hypothetical protein [Limibaculum sp. NKW23]GMG84975.1 hypothetical protein LNKW23_41910 [Limibaculum sp. NKW23]
MTSRLSDEVRRTFELASRRREAKQLRTGEDWRSLQQVQVHFAKAQREEKRTFRAEYETRVEAEKQKLIDKAADQDPTPKPWWSREDKFGRAAIERQAHRNVRRAHEKSIARLEERESEALKTLMTRAAKRDRLREKTLTDFARTTDRRSGEERRQSPRRGPRMSDD